MTEKTGGRARRLLKNTLIAVLVLGAVGGGVAYTAVTVDAADRTAPTVAWERPTATATPGDPAADIGRGRASTPMSKLLLPVPDGYVLGSDIDEYGNDGELDGKAAAALFKRTSRTVYGKERRAYEKAVDALGVQGMAVRSYARVDNSLQAEVLVLRMKDRKAVRKFYEIRKDLGELLDLDKGPKIEGHTKNAVCHLGPEPTKPEKGPDDEFRTPELRKVLCVAYEGEVMVTVTAYGIPPLDTKAVAGLLGKQIRHIESPGEYV
ncbi:hypothetical protein ACIQCR_27325 [Streptomyces sp. NPDC093249]|uniref:hypothetical protein n=1 Tax=unclassified Streptomyces TaxID=2593676 RepID=UPI00344B4F35